MFAHALDNVRPENVTAPGVNSVVADHCKLLCAWRDEDEDAVAFPCRCHAEFLELLLGRSDRVVELAALDRKTRISPEVFFSASAIA